MKCLAALTGLVLWLGCGAAPVGVSEQADQRPPGVICGPSTWQPSAEPPMTGGCLWVPNAYGPQANVQACDTRWDVPSGYIDIFDRPYTLSGGIYSPPYGTANCARLNDSVGGFFDWTTFQYFGWANPGSPIRSVRIGPHTTVVFGDKAFDSHAPDYCDETGHCYGWAGGSMIPANIVDTWTAAFSGFAMASVWVHRP